MKYKAGDKVRIRSKEWYESHKNKFGKVWTVCLSGKGAICFDQDNAKYCGKEVIIFSVELDNYVLRGIPYEWTDEMFEGLVEEETKPEYEDEVNGEYYSTPKYLVRPSGYQFVDENGNVINATKIVLEKKKKEYPKTYCECKDILGLWDIDDTERGYYKTDLIDKLQMLLICRDAYWKIAGEEMGLGKPWEPDFDNNEEYKYGLFRFRNIIYKDASCINPTLLIFPTPEMRDAFYENFKKDIEFCKELL